MDKKEKAEIVAMLVTYLSLEWINPKEAFGLYKFYGCDK